MAGFNNGIWRLVGQSNLEAYHNHINSPEARKEQVRDTVKSIKTNPEKYHWVFNVDLDAKTVLRIAHINGEKVRETKFPIGVEADLKGPDGRPYKGILTFDGDTKMKVHQKGADFEINFLYDLNGDIVEATLDGGSVVAKETYKRF